jgi:hypothetical protein
MVVEVGSARDRRNDGASRRYLSMRQGAGERKWSVAVVSAGAMHADRAEMLTKDRT